MVRGKGLFNAVVIQDHINSWDVCLEVRFKLQGPAKRLFPGCVNCLPIVAWLVLSKTEKTFLLGSVHVVHYLTFHCIYIEADGKEWYPHQTDPQQHNKVRKKSHNVRPKHLTEDLCVLR